MNTIQLECFISVAKHLNFSKASEEVRISQPAVSHQINSLEKELDTKLFTRTSKSVRLTPEELLFLPDADRILKIATSARTRLSNREQPVVLEIGCHTRTELNLLPGAIRELKKEYPQLRPIVHMVPFEALARLLGSGQIDMMFGPKHAHIQEGFRFFELFSCPVVCICSKNHPLATYPSLTCDMLSGDIVLSEPHRTYDDIFQIQTSLAARPATGQRYFGDSYETLIMLVRAELGYTVLPDLRFVRDEALCYIPLTDVPPVSFGVYSQKAGETPLVKRFRLLLKNTCNL